MTREAAGTPPSEAALTRDTRIVRSIDQASADLDDETVIMSMPDGVYYGLDAVGTRIWTLVAEPVTLGAVLERIVLEYDVGSQAAWRDLVALIEEMLARGLVTRLPPDP